MAGLDKLEAVIDGRSVLQRSVEALAAGGAERIVVVTAAERVAGVAAAEWLPVSVAAVVAGGERRQESVAAGVAALTDATTGATAQAAAGDPVILIHDAARPLASPDLVRAVAAATVAHGAAIPVLAVAETLKRLDGELIGETIDRTHVAAAQTPQGVRLSLLMSAYEDHSADGIETWTDEAALLEACRIPVHAIPGEATNLKVTVPADLERAGAILAAGPTAGAGGSGTPASVRVGLGTDNHPFGSGEPLVLGGVRIEGVPRLAGHSDGDVALHAVADALLGAAGLGDLGRLFPADLRTPEGSDSRELLAVVVARVREAGWAPVNVDVTIVAARPRLAGLLPEMGRSIAEILSVAPESVNVKASTGNMSGPEGEGRAISASAVALVAAAGGEGAA
jgi:2-C-methyl-D-erythritol 4-phosphate cytidylyltransferase/2-C-methyl-D-erythritol 2,4-cyclodiphosphate synthase